MRHFLRHVIMLLGFTSLCVIFQQILLVVSLEVEKGSHFWNQKLDPTSPPVLTSYPQSYHLKYDTRSRKICQLHNESQNLISLLFMVHSGPGHFQERSKIRQTFTNKSYFTDHEIRVVFLLGKPANQETQVNIEEEFLLYGDIVQGGFTDSYRNLSLKAVTGLRWITENCHNVSMVVKIDDDVIINTFRLLDEVLPNTTNKTLICRPRPEGKARVIRVGKWKMNQAHLMDYKYYPWTYCGGAAVFISGDLIPLLYKASLTAPLLWVDDLYMTGVLTSRVHGIQIEERQHSLNFKQTEKCFSKPGCKYLFGAAKHADMPRIWNSMLYRAQSNG